MVLLIAFTDPPLAARGTRHRVKIISNTSFRERLTQLSHSRPTHSSPLLSPPISSFVLLPPFPRDSDSLRNICRLAVTVHFSLSHCSLSVSVCTPCYV